MNHRNLSILIGTTCLGIAAGIVFFSKDTLATSLPAPLDYQQAPVEPVLDRSDLDDAAPVTSDFSPSEMARAAEAPVRVQPTGWTSGVIRGDVVLAVSALDKLGSMTVIVEELRSGFDRNGTAPKRIMQPVERGVGTPTFEVRDVPFSDHPYRVTLHAPGLNTSARTLTVDEAHPLHEDVRLAITSGAPYSVLLRDQDGGAHRDIDLLLRPHGLPHGRPRLSGKTDNFGSVVFDDVLAGQYELVATLDGQPFGRPEMVVVAEGQRLVHGKVRGQGHVMTIARGVRLDLEVGDGFYGVEGATVTMVRTDQRRLQELEATTDSLGRARFPHLQPGQWQLTVEREHFLRVDRQFTLQADMEPQFKRIKMARSGY